MERSGWSMQVHLRFALLHSELLSLLEVSNGNHTAKQQDGKATLAEETAHDWLLMDLGGKCKFSFLTSFFSFSISSICYITFIRCPTRLHKIDFHFYMVLILLTVTKCSDTWNYAHITHFTQDSIATVYSVIPFLFHNRRCHSGLFVIEKTLYNCPQSGLRELALHGEKSRYILYLKLFFNPTQC